MSYYLLSVLKLIIVFIILPLSVVGLIFLLLKNWTNRKIAVIFAGISLSIFAYFVITDIYPRQTFFEGNFKENTKLTIPRSAKLLYTSGNQSIWNFGDYNLSYVYELSSDDYKKLGQQLKTEGYTQNESWMQTAEVEEMLHKCLNQQVTKILTKDFGFKRFDILFLNDDRTVIFNSNKW